MALILHFILHRKINLSLGFRVGNFRDGGFLNIDFDFFPYKINLSLGFRLERFRDGDLLILNLFFFSKKY